MDKIQELEDFKAGAVQRGDQGKATTVSSPGCIVMPDFDSPTEFSGDPGELSKKIAFIASCFLLIKGYTKLEDAENAALALAEKVLSKVQNAEFQVNMNGNMKYYHWELKRMDFLQRTSSLAVLNIEFQYYLQT